jgi:hypothetical protein
LIAVTLFARGAAGDVLVDQATMIGAASVAPPSEYTFTESTAQALTVTLTDLQTPAAFTSLQIAVTLGTTLVGSATLASGAQTATLSLPAATGTYTVNVIGAPDSTQGLGEFGVCIAPASGPANACIAADSYSGNIQTPASAATTGMTPLVTSFTSTANGGTYKVTITDDQFPVALQSISGGITLGSTPVFGPLTTGVNTVPAIAANTTYELLIGATANATTLAGLYGIVITDPTGAVVFSRSVAVGSLSTATYVTNPSAQSLQLSLTDFGYPAPLTSVGVAVTSAGTALTTITAPGSSPMFDAPAGPLQLWQYAHAGMQPGVYQVSLNAGTTALYSSTQVAQLSNAATATSFAYIANLPSAGAYTGTVTDFAFPGSLQTLEFTVAQNGTQLDVNGGAFTAAAGPVVVLVDAQPQTGSIGLFSVTVGAGGAATPILDQVQEVGGVIASSTVTVGESGQFNLTLTDLAFPAQFSDLALVLSNGGQVLAKIYGGGTYLLTAAPGTYQLNLVAVPGSTNYGLYSLNIESAPPSVTLTASATSVPSGQSVQLTWNSTNATSCTASGATDWNGSEALSGTTAVAITSTTTLTLTCTGPGGTSAPQSVNVTATAALSHGGGSLDVASVFGLASLLLLRRSRARALRGRRDPA